MAISILFLQDGGCPSQTVPIRYNMLLALQPYSSWSCSPAELHYASDCGAKVQTLMKSAKKTEGKVILQFELLSTYYSNSSCKMSYTPKTEGKVILQFELLSTYYSNSSCKMSYTPILPDAWSERVAQGAVSVTQGAVSITHCATDLSSNVISRKFDDY